MRKIYCILLLMCTLVLAGCGNSGPLYLPQAADNNSINQIK